ncbi:lysine/arginine/ornithine ABC transporter periplasmic binding protein [Paraburkholderia sacchari]|uniref:ABC transporter substrate-binding protein n=1 Tax=Paraburkholderia sacchari TaxID=159450 RepID=UPI0039A6B360
MKRISAAVIIALFAASATGVQAKTWSTIRFGVDASYPPYESKAPDGQLVGFDIDLGNEICQHLHAKCVWVEQDFDSMIPALKARKFDAILSTMSKTAAREQQIAFSTKVAHSPDRMVARKGATILPTPEGVKGKRIGVEQGSIQETYARVHWEPAGATIVPYQNQDLVYADLISGRLDASVQDQVHANLGFLNTPRGKDFAFVGTTLDDLKILGNGTAIGMRKDDADLREKIDQALADMHKDGTYDKVARKYFDFDIYGK